MVIQLVCISKRRAVRKVTHYSLHCLPHHSPMKLCVTQLALLLFTLDAATFLVASRPHRASSTIEIRNLKNRNVDTFDLSSRSRNIKAREPTPADLAAPATYLETRDVDELDVYSRDIEAREPVSVDLAVAAFDLERRNPVGAIVDIAKMIVDVIVNIKKAFEADKEVCRRLFLVHIFPDANDNLNSTVTSGRTS
jgi:hypothetical protein